MGSPFPSRAPASGVSEARLLLDADHVMADAPSTGNEISAQSAVRSCAICDECVTDNALANRQQITHRFDGGLRQRQRGVSNPPGRLQEGSGSRTGCSRPRSISDTGQVGFLRGTERRARCSASQLASRRCGDLRQEFPLPEHIILGPVMKESEMRLAGIEIGGLV